MTQLTIINILRISSTVIHCINLFCNIIIYSSTLYFYFSGYGINFQKAHDDFKNIALQISPRGNSSYVVLNSRINGKWQTEEHVRYNDQKSMQDIFFKNPLELSMQPEKDNHTLISFNGSLVTGFNCKVDLTEAKYLVLSHDIELQHSKYDSNNTGTDISHGLDNEEDGTYSDRISQDSDEL